MTGGACGLRHRVLVTVLGLVLVASVLSACSSDSGSDDAAGVPTKLTGVVPKPIPDVSALSLPVASSDATPFPFVAKPGQLLLVYFGYTACPDICPTTLADLRAAVRDLGDKATDVSVVFATVDPRRDSTDVVTGYLHSFFPTGVALRTDDDATLRAVATAFGASYQVNYQTVGEPTVVHSAYTYAVDDRGHLVVEWPFGSRSKDIAADLRQLLAEKETKS